MDAKELEELRELVDFLKANGIAEFDMERTDLKVRIKFAGAAGPSAVDLALARQMIASSGGGGIPSPSAAAPATPVAPEPEEKLHEVKSPIVGTFYDSSSPGAAPFVKVGDQVDEDHPMVDVMTDKATVEMTSPIAGRVLALHGESDATWPASDALCAALQVLNHLQDCAKDLRDLDRCYIAEDWLKNAGLSIDDLARPETTPALRAVFDKMLDETGKLNALAATLPGQVKDRRMRIECALIVRLAQRLTTLLRHGDPLAGRVKLSKLDFALAAIAGLKYLL